VENGYVPSVRLDIWLDVACLYRTRSEAQRACRGGKVDVNGQAAKPHRLVKQGDVVELTRQAGRRQRVIVKNLTEKHIPKAEARLLYEDVTPPPTPEEQALLDLLRLAGPRRPRGPVASPNKRERRRLREAKERGE